MAEWRFGRGWTDAELERRLADAQRRPRNFGESPAGMTPESCWNRHYSEATIALDAAGPPPAGGPFERAWEFVQAYAFSDPRIIRGHFDRSSPLRGRVMLLEARVLGLHYLGPVRIGAVRDTATDARTERGFRYDTLAGHFERGSEWFILAQDHESGAVTFRIHAAWQPGELPNWWSRIGFRLLSRRYQRAWHRLAHLRLRTLLGAVGLDPLPRGARLVHEGPPLPMTPVQIAAAGEAPDPVVTEREEDSTRTEVA